LIGLGVSALENDLRQAGFGWRQLFAGLTVTASGRRRRSRSSAIFA
jgi:hypothetical protein